MRKLNVDELDRIDVNGYKTSVKYPFTLILDNIRSLHNIGSIFRTADAFLIEKLFLCGITATPPHREIHKTALGATESVEWHYEQNIVFVLNKLIALGYQIIAIEQTTESITLNKFSINKSMKYALILGNEVYGVSPEALGLCHQAIEIPQFGTKHSFNVSVTTGIVLWDLFNKFNH